jgi:hypothetical protein
MAFLPPHTTRAILLSMLPTTSGQSVAATGDFFHTGGADILRRDNNGAITEWSFGLNAGDFLVV